MNQWRKRGCIFTPGAAHPKLMSHAANPLAVHLRENIYRIFYSGRDAQNASSVGYVDLDIITHTIIAAPDVPAFTHGAPNSFYENGVSVGNVYRAADGHAYMGFMGWQNAAGNHWRGDIGRLRMSDNQHLVLDPPTIWLGTDDAVDPISLSYPWIMRKGDGEYHMWYGSTLTWDAGNGEMLHVLHQATSPDGHHWTRLGLAVPYQLGVAQAFSRPTVVADETGYHMWFSYRSGAGTPYRIGYAHSADSYRWVLKPEDAGIDVSPEGWDCEMICYPFVFDHRGERYMLYNGNGYGKSGFGIAVLGE